MYPVKRSDRKSETLKTLVTEEEKIKFIQFCNRINRSPSFVLRRLATCVVNAESNPRLILEILNA